MGPDRLESAFRNRLEFPSGIKLSAMVNSDFARQRGEMVLQRSTLRTGHGEPVSQENKREKEDIRASAAQTQKVCVCHHDTHGLI